MSQQSPEGSEFPPPPSDFIGKPRGFRSVASPISNDPERKQWYKNMFKQMHGGSSSDGGVAVTSSLAAVVHEEDKKAKHHPVVAVEEERNSPHETAQKVEVVHRQQKVAENVKRLSNSHQYPPPPPVVDNVKRLSNPFIPKSPLDFISPQQQPEVVTQKRNSQDIERHSLTYIPKTPLDFVTPAYETKDTKFTFKERPLSTGSNISIPEKIEPVATYQPPPVQKQKSPPAKVVPQKKQAAKEAAAPVEKGIVKFKFVGKSDKELSMKKDEVVFIIKQIDANWYQCESVGGKTGIIPVNYVEKLEQNYIEKTVVTPGKATLKFDFNGKTKRELTCMKGVEIQLVSKVDKNWYKGKLNDAQGLVPAAYLDVQVEPVTKKVKQQINVGTPSNHVKPQLQMSAEDEDQRSKNQVINELKQNVNTVLSPGRNPVSPRGSIPLVDQLEIVDNIELPPSIPSEPSSSIVTSSQSSRIASPVNLPDPVNLPPPLETSSTDYGIVIGTYKALYPYTASNDDEIDLLAGDLIHVVEVCDDGWFVGTCQRTQQFGTFPGNYVTNVS